MRSFPSTYSTVPLSSLVEVDEPVFVVLFVLVGWAAAKLANPESKAIEVRMAPIRERFLRYGLILNELI
jgi:hypothetical protein